MVWSGCFFVKSDINDKKDENLKEPVIPAKAGIQNKAECTRFPFHGNDSQRNIWKQRAHFEIRFKERAICNQD